jgi:hypothetical protein
MNKVKLFLSAVVLGVASVAFASGGIDSKIDAYEKACKDKDLVEMAKIANDLLKMEADMTQEQKLRYANIAVNCN